jgi:hypothetical protein
MRRRNNPNWGAKLRNIFLILLYNVEKYDFLTRTRPGKARLENKIVSFIQQHFGTAHLGKEV